MVRFQAEDIDNARLRQAVKDFGHTLAEVMGQDWAWLALYQKCRSEHLLGDASKIALVDPYDGGLLDVAENNIEEFQGQAEMLLDDLFIAKPGTEQEKLTQIWDSLAAVWTHWVSAKRQCVTKSYVNGLIQGQSTLASSQLALPQHSRRKFPSFLS